MVKVTIVTAEWCKGCKVLKAALNKAGIDYKEVDVDTEDALPFVELHNVKGLPTTIVESSEGKVNMVVGSSHSAVEDIVGLVEELG